MGLCVRICCSYVLGSISQSRSASCVRLLGLPGLLDGQGGFLWSQGQSGTSGPARPRQGESRRETTDYLCSQPSRQSTSLLASHSESELFHHLQARPAGTRFAAATSSLLGTLFTAADHGKSARDVAANIDRFATQEKEQRQAIDCQPNSSKRCSWIARERFFPGQTPGDCHLLASPWLLLRLHQKRQLRLRRRRRRQDQHQRRRRSCRRRRNTPSTWAASQHR